MAHSHPNPREMDVARSLVNLAHDSEGNRNTNPNVNANVNVINQTRPYLQQQNRSSRAARRGAQNRVIMPSPGEGPNHTPLGHARNNYTAQPAQLMNPVPALARTATGGSALQGHLIRQQLLAGIAPENVVTINRHRQTNPIANINSEQTPSLIHITNQGVYFPPVPPTTYIPSTTYPITVNPLIKEEIPTGQYLQVPQERHFNESRAFERPPSAFAANMARNNFGACGPQDHQYAGPMNEFPPAVGGYAQGAYMPPGYFQPPTNPFNPTPEYYGHTTFPQVKAEPNAELNAEHHYYMPPDNKTDIFGPAFAGNAHLAHGIPNLKRESYPRPPPIQRAPFQYPVTGYGMVDEHGRGAPQTMQNANPAHFIGRRHPGQPQMSTLERPSGFTQRTKTVIKEEPTLKSQGVMPEVIAHEAPHDFNILGALLKHPEIAILMTGNLNVQDLINLQTTSKACNSFVVKYLPKIIRLQTLHRSRAASHIFPWRCYRKLLFKRLAGQDENVPVPVADLGGSVLAYTASFRWLQMVRSRDQTIHTILIALRNAGFGFPPRYKFAIYKLWFLMDIPDTRRREWTVANRNLWTDLDLFMAIFFIVRIDMFVKVVRGNLTGGQRRLIMAQRSLNLCRDMLTGRALRNNIELLSELIRWRYNSYPGEELGDEVLGVPVVEIGSLQYEGYGKGRELNRKLRRPDKIILREARRRGLDVHQMYVRIFVQGQPQTLTACDRPLIPWDLEVRTVFQGTNENIDAFVRLD